MKYKYYYWGPLLCHMQIKQEELDLVKKLCIKDITKLFIINLAGNIKDEYLINVDALSSILAPYMETFRSAHFNWYNKHVSELEINQAGVNYMKPGDYNRVHTHDNCRFSAVLFVDVPEKLKEEMGQYNGTGAGPGCTEFIYGESYNYAIANKVVVPENGHLYMFPHTLRHVVNPFKSDCERISLGINFKTKEK